jgi:hypothetical protein
VADNGDCFVRVHQTVGYGYGLFRLAGVVAFNQFDLLTVDTACGVDIGGGLFSALPQLLTKGSITTGHWTGYADNDIGKGYGSQAHSTGNRERQNTFLKSFLVRHGVLLLRGYVKAQMVEQAACHTFLI